MNIDKRFICHKKEVVTSKTIPLYKKTLQERSKTPMHG